MFTAVLQRAQIETQLRQFQKMDTLNKVAGSVAHDFNNLLMSIMSSTDFALSQVERDKALYETLLQINWASERGKVLTRKLLSFSRSESFEPQSVCVHDVIQEMIPIIKQITRENIDFHIECTDYTLHIQIDQQDFENALLNLLINARDAIDENSNNESIIAITIQRVDRQTESYLSLAISDTVEFQKQHSLKSLNPLHNKTQRDGLGLSMVQSVVERAHGSISIAALQQGPPLQYCFH